MIRIEYPDDDLEKIENPSFIERPTDRPRAFAFTEPVPLDVRMRNRLIAGGGMGLKGHDGIIPFLATIESELDIERPKIDVLEHNRFGDDADDILLEIAFRCGEFRIERRKFRVEIP